MNHRYSGINIKGRIDERNLIHSLFAWEKKIMGMSAAGSHIKPPTQNNWGIRRGLIANTDSSNP